MPALTIHHLGLSVADLHKTTEFFKTVLGFEIVNELPEYPAKFISNGKAFLTLWQTEPDALAFNRRTRVGLHHFALAVDSESQLHSLFEKASHYPGVKIDFSPQPLGDSGAVHAILFEPGGIRFELIWVGS